MAGWDTEKKNKCPYKNLQFFHFSTQWVANSLQNCCVKFCPIKVVICITHFYSFEGEISHIIPVINFKIQYSRYIVTLFPYSNKGAEFVPLDIFFLSQFTHRKGEFCVNKTFCPL